MKAITWCPTGDQLISAGVPNNPRDDMPKVKFILSSSHTCYHLAFPNSCKSKLSYPVAQGGGPGGQEGSQRPLLPLPPRHPVHTVRTSSCTLMFACPSPQPRPPCDLLSSLLHFQKNLPVCFPFLFPLHPSFSSTESSERSPKQIWLCHFSAQNSSLICIYSLESFLRVSTLKWREPVFEPWFAICVTCQVH